MMRHEMVTAVRNAIAALAIALLASAPAMATDFTDLWWTPSESGWGLNIAHQADTMYVTLYVYGTNSRATWYSATLHYAGSDTAGNLVYSGDLYEVTGPWFGAIFNPAAVTVRRAGDATFRGTSVETGILSYSVDGIPVTKNIQRTTLATMDITGEYLGGIVQTNFNCTNPALNGKTEDAAFLSITQTGTDVQMVANSARRVCSYRGTYGQAGRMGSIANATYTCSDGTSGTFAAFEIDLSTSGILARFQGNGGGCAFSGDIAGALR